MTLPKLTRLFACTLLAASLAACSNDDDTLPQTGSNSDNTAGETSTDTGSGGSGSGGTGSGGSGSGSGGSGGSTSAQLLDPAQAGLSQLLSSLAGAGGSSNPLSGLITCLDPTVNDLLDGPDALLTGIVSSLTTGGVQDPAALGSNLLGAGESLTLSLQSLTVNLPRALMALADPSVAEDCDAFASSGDNPLQSLIDLVNQGNASSNNPFANTPIAILFKPTQGGSGPTGTPIDMLLGPLLQLQNGGVPNGQIVDQLGQGVQMLALTLQSGLPPQLEGAPLVGDTLGLLGTTLLDLGKVLDKIEQPSTSGELEATLNNLLSNLVGTLAGLDPTGQVSGAVEPQLLSGIDTLTGTLGDVLLDPIAGGGGVLPSLLTPLEALTCGLQLLGDCDGAGELPTGSDIPLIGDLLDGLGGSTSSNDGSVSSQLEQIPLIGGLLSGLLGLLGV